MYEIFEKLLQKKNVTANAVCRETGIVYTTIYSWKNGKYHPRDEKLSAIAKYFGVSLEYLKGEAKEIECPECHMMYDPLDDAGHNDYHNMFLAAEKKYGLEIPSRAEAERCRMDELSMLRDIKYDKYRRMAAFNRFAKCDFMLRLYDSGFDPSLSLEAHVKEQAEQLRPDNALSLNLCNAIRAEFGVDEYKEELNRNVTEREYKLIACYRSLSPEVAGVVDKILGVEDAK